MKKYLRKIFGILGIVIFIFTIINEIDGVGRFACLLFGTIFSLLGIFLPGEKHE